MNLGRKNIVAELSVALHSIEYGTLDTWYRMASTLELPVTNAVARHMTVVAETAADELGASRAEQNAIRTVGRRLLDDVSRPDAAAVFGGGDSDDAFTTLSVSSSTLRTYLNALDTLATRTATPHRRKSCQTVFSHLTALVDVDALGLRLADYDTLDPNGGRRVFS